MTAAACWWTAVRTIDNALLYGYQLVKKILGELIQRCPIF